MMGISYQKKRQTPKRKAARSNRAEDASESASLLKRLADFC